MESWLSRLCVVHKWRLYTAIETIRNDNVSAAVVHNCYVCKKNWENKAVYFRFFFCSRSRRLPTIDHESCYTGRESKTRVGKFLRARPAISNSSCRTERGYTRTTITSATNTPPTWSIRIRRLSIRITTMRITRTIWWLSSSKNSRRARQSRRPPLRQRLQRRRRPPQRRRHRRRRQRP